MFQTSIHTIGQFKEILSQLPGSSYSQSCEALSNATIGQHTRHIIELYQCLIKGYETADVSYDKRERNKRLEHEVEYAIEQLENIQRHLERPDKDIQISYELEEGCEVCLRSNYYREVMYNLEHTIHHHALIKIGILALTDMQLPTSFGVAPSTIQFRKACAQ